MTTMAELTGMTIELDDDMNQAVNNYTIEFSTSVPVYNGDILYMTFPDECDLETSVECDVDYDITTDIETIDCSNTGQALTVEMLTFDTSGSTGDFSFILMDVTNPETTAPSSAFSGIYITDSSGYSVAQYTTTLTVDTDTAATLDVTLTQSSYLPGDEATYTFSWTPNALYPEDAVVRLTYPDSVSLTSKFDCVVRGPRTSSNLCTISTISQTFEIERAFIGWHYGYDD